MIEVSRQVRLLCKETLLPWNIQRCQRVSCYYRIKVITNAAGFFLCCIEPKPQRWRDIFFSVDFGRDFFIAKRNKKSWYTKPEKIKPPQNFLQNFLGFFQYCQTAKQFYLFLIFLEVKNMEADPGRLRSEKINTNGQCLHILQ